MLYHNVVLTSIRNPDKVRGELTEHAVRSRKEPGCLRFDVHDAPTLVDSFILTEQWESLEAINKHRLADSYQMVYRPVLHRCLRRSGGNAVAFDFDRTLTIHSKPVSSIIAVLRHHASMGWSPWILTARNPLYDDALIRNYDEPQRLLVSEAVNDWKLPIVGVRFTNNKPKILHLIELGCCCIFDDDFQTCSDARQHGLKSVLVRNGCFL